MTSFSLSPPGTDSPSSPFPFRLSFTEKLALLPPLRPGSSRLGTLLRSQISLAHTYLPLILCCLITGLLDSTLFYAYGTFVSGQTGNSVLFGLGASTSHTPRTRPYRWAKSLVAILCFSLGCFVFGHTTRLLGNRRRGTLMLSFLVQAAIVLIAAGFIHAYVVEGRLQHINDDMDWRQIVPISLLSFQSAGQIVASRTLGHDTMPTVVVTSMLHDIATDPRLWVSWRENEKRFQRFGAWAAIVIGALAGGFLAVKTGDVQNTLWLVGSIKIGIVIIWGFWPAAETDNEMNGS